MFQTALYVRSNGREYPVVRTAWTMIDPLGNIITVTMDMTETVAPMGNRVQTTVTIYPHNGVNGAFVGATVLNPLDQYNYNYALKLGLIRAFESYLARNIGENNLFDFAMLNVLGNGRLLKQWAGQQVAQLRQRGADPKSVAEMVENAVAQAKENGRVLRETGDNELSRVVSRNQGQGRYPDPDASPFLEDLLKGFFKRVSPPDTDPFNFEGLK